MSDYRPKPTPRNFRLRQEPTEAAGKRNLKWEELGSGGELIAEARKRAVISQSELARRMGAHQQAISRWERGLAEPPFSTVLRALGACGWDLVGALTARSHDRKLLKDPPPIGPATFVLTPQDAKDPIDRQTTNLRQLKDSQRAWRREFKKHSEAR